ncbi:hypothetical protein SAMN06265365_13642 [Tistlia consotensis]|uniref:Uncharacterized protein n=1 Tax=Tistlia consotensis USBA 355 TaxID=560819 RepID=A0A1Y6CVV7_9PROT|nr:hypothetical protein [Tistlia consotensis]SMF78437.1 hypothetical protein SAMN05428998_13843 [Tistlia consotensis USBA 355]SNS18509.1 hypothetical protein SAMN06265365_13642 [Tistlia consotensis]
MARRSTARLAPPRLAHARLATRRLAACLALAGALLFPALAVAQESESVVVHIIPGQYLRMIVGQETSAEVRLLAIVRNHDRQAVRVTASRCEAFGPESEAELAEAESLGGHLCQIDPPPPWELHASKQHRIGIAWPVPTPAMASGTPRVAPGSPHDVQFVGLRIWRSEVHDTPRDRLHLILTLEDGREVVSEGFHLVPFGHTPRFTRRYTGFGSR